MGGKVGEGKGKKESARGQSYNLGGKGSVEGGKKSWAIK